VSTVASVSDQYRDELPDDLDVSGLVGPYQFPDVRRRRIPAVLYTVVALFCLLGFASTKNEGLLVVAITLLVIAVYHWWCAWSLKVDQTQALIAASRAIGFPVGHASAQLAWRGWRSRPTWRILVYSADTPPTRRGLVELDGVNGEVLGSYDEANPEDWADLAS
jgi:hypothetical protein